MVCKVVTVEDEVEIAELLRVVLHSPEIEVLTADNGPDGLELIRQIKPHLIILDIMMPGGINGWDIYDAVRADELLKRTPIIMLSVMREKPERRQAFEGSDIDLYMTKPFDTLRLRKEIERMLGRTGLWSPPKPRLAKPLPLPDPAELLQLMEQLTELKAGQETALAVQDRLPAEELAKPEPTAETKPEPSSAPPPSTGEADHNAQS